MANSIKFMNEGFDAKYGNIKPDLCEQIYTVLKRLTEADISPEDKADTKLLYSIYDKKMKRSNAALTPEEKAVLNKYNLGDVYSYKNGWGAKRAATGYTQGSDVYEPIKRGQHIRGTETNRKVNLADRARKMGMRAYNKGAVGEYDREFKNNYNTMKDDIWSREYHQKKLDSLDKSYDEKEAKLLKQLDSLKKDKENSKRYHQGALDTSNSRINKMLKRESLLSEDKLRGFNDGEKLKHEINEFLENLVIRWNHEYDIQLTRADIDNAYEFVMLHFLWDEVLDESFKK